MVDRLDEVLKLRSSTNHRSIKLRCAAGIETGGLLRWTRSPVGAYTADHRLQCAIRASG
ncbi:MAG UNVERIFIED_CONTAM: hypothetical protein LVR18_43295 [Planctomycetaceae bacterium]